ncbi:MAG: helix-turn-helix transcriptional regulator [Clostridia bacterium]|nr:helix-turn-helix transcriptional regulator [Clostridia bacterium]
MTNVKEIVRANLVTLRKGKKLTQMELSELVGYSDKAISRWETGEVTPDIETLARLAEIYGVDISVFFSEYNEKEYKAKTLREMQVGKKIAVAVLVMSVIWYIGIMMFAYANSFSEIGRSWLIFIWLLPITFATASLFSVKWGTPTITMVVSSLFFWSLLTAVYLQLIEHNVFLLFISGAPIQIVIILLFYIRKKNPSGR